jgi:rhodanese-related sulfurtransferase
VLANYTSIAKISAENNHFPLRQTFSSVLTLSHQELINNFNNFLIIDVRSTYEFKVLHIENSINVPITNRGFIPMLLELRANDSRGIAFYCNGIACEKSYLASVNATQYGITDVYTFDLGVLTWAKIYPHKVKFFGKTPLALTKLISNEEFTRHVLSPKEFVQKISENTLVIDIREPFQRTKTILEIESILTPLNQFHLMLDIIIKKNATLLIYDAVGKQVKWLQYLLKEKGVKNYYFMKGGVKAYIDEGLD